MASATCEIDEYEMLTLHLEYTEEKDYMPMQLVLDYQEPNEVEPDLTSCRPRRGQAGRVWPLGDFQKDILPGNRTECGASKQFSSVEGLGLDERSLTGWGNRRQRYTAAGHSVAT
ncbi:hypothetical protein R6Q59_004885 [Mikania micrantha]